MPLVHPNMKHPKLTTAAAMFFGRRACRHVVHLDRPQTDAYLHGQVTAVASSRLQACDDRGYVIVKHEQIPLGVALLRRQNGTWRLESAYPKAWRLPTGTSAFKPA
ncbi:MAG: hypothetical protein D6743_01950 [Calditrichaeota bacterium]|nr:MAG: hypothetical protein D6743_01950 [Calditrichota bacterium]